MTCFLPGLLALTASLVFVVGCNKEPEISTFEDVQKASEGKEALDPGVEVPDANEMERRRKLMEESGGIRMPPGKGQGTSE